VQRTASTAEQARKEKFVKKKVSDAAKKKLVKGERPARHAAKSAFTVTFELHQRRKTPASK